MSTLVLERIEGMRVLDHAAVGLARTALTGSSEGLTLDDVISSVWEGLSAHEHVRCPACGGAMAPRYAAGPSALGGACRDCGSLLS